MEHPKSLAAPDAGLNSGGGVLKSKEVGNVLERRAVHKSTAIGHAFLCRDFRLPRVERGV